jgi:hypothetical protein
MRMPSNSLTPGSQTISITGEGERLVSLSDCLAVSPRSKPLIQQAQLFLYHYLCQSVEREMAIDHLGQQLTAPAC